MKYSVGTHLGEKSGFYSNLEYRALSKTEPLNSTNFLRHIQFAIGYGGHGDWTARTQIKPQWSCGVEVAGFAFIGRVFSIGPVLSLEQNGRTGTSLKGATELRWMSEDLMVRGELGGITPFGNATSDGYYNLCVDAYVCKIGSASIYLGGQITNQDLKQGTNGYWDVDPAKDNRRSSVSTRISIVY